MRTLSTFLVEMENLMLREMRVGEMLMENRSVSFICRLLLWRLLISANVAFVR